MFPFIFETIVFLLSIGILFFIMISLTTPFNETLLRKNIISTMSEHENNYVPELKGVINVDDAIQTIKTTWKNNIVKTVFTSKGTKIPIPNDDKDEFIEKKEMTDLRKIRTNTLTEGANNCLFEATLDALSIDKRRITPQMLRNVCDLVLSKEGFPLIPKGETAGEQYLQALSKIFERKIIVDKNGYKSSVVIRHWEVPEDCEQFKLRHLGHSVFGHWVSGE